MDELKVFIWLGADQEDTKFAVIARTKEQALKLVIEKYAAVGMGDERAFHYYYDDTDCVYPLEEGLVLGL